MSDRSSGSRATPGSSSKASSASRRNPASPKKSAGKKASKTAAKARNLPTTPLAEKPARKPGARVPKPPPPGSVPTRVIAVANQKGGVGKSTTAVSLGAALAELGYGVLVVDLDPQGNASTGLGLRHEHREVTVYDVLATEAAVEGAIMPTALPGLFAIPSTIDLAGAEIELVSQFSREMRLRKALAPLREAVAYDFILLDCPPSLGLLTINALVAAEELIVPIQCEYYALEGLGQLLRNVRLVQQNVNQLLRLTGIVMTMFDPRTKLSEQVVDEVRRFFGERVYETVIPRTVRLSEAPGFGQPITVYDPKSRGAETYRSLAREVAAKAAPEEPLPAFEELPTVIVTAPEAAPAPARDVPHETLTEVESEEAEVTEMEEAAEELAALAGEPLPPPQVEGVEILPAPVQVEEAEEPAEPQVEAELAPSWRPNADEAVAELRELARAAGAEDASSAPSPQAQGLGEDEFETEETFEIAEETAVAEATAASEPEAEVEPDGRFATVAAEGRTLERRGASTAAEAGVEPSPTAPPHIVRAVEPRGAAREPEPAVEPEPRRKEGPEPVPALPDTLPIEGKKRRWWRKGGD